MRTVRFRLTVWYSTLLLILGLAFILFLNVAARLDELDDQAFMDERGLSEAEWQTTGGAGDTGEASGGDPGYLTPAELVAEASREFQAENLDRLRTWSIVAGFALAIISGFGGFALSGIILRPVRDITAVASEISATNLSQRINHEGPDDELKKLADTFDSMIDRIERGFEAQRRFVQDASHELRTPLAAIRTNIEVAELAGEGEHAEQRALLETVKGQTERLTRLSEDLLLLTAPQGTLTLETVDPGELVALALDEIAPLAARARVTLAANAQASCEAIASADLLYRCVFNLLDNAVKHTEAGAVVTIETGCDGERVWIRVQDDGPGIPPEDLAHIFDRFFRVDRSRARGRGGSGLGLAIVQELMESMGGTVAVASTPGEGATFTLRLRHAAGANGASPHRSEASVP